LHALCCYLCLSKIHTPVLPDPTLLSYHKWMNERRTLSSLGCRSETQKIVDPRRVVSEQGFRSYHRTATPLSDGRTAQSALSWQTHDQTNIESPARRLGFLFFISKNLFHVYFLVLNIIILNNNHKIQQVLIQLIDHYHIYVVVQHHHQHLLHEIVHQLILI
jgi:hypothetical protein